MNRITGSNLQHHEVWFVHRSCTIGCTAHRRHRFEVKCGMEHLIQERNARSDFSAHSSHACSGDNRGQWASLFVWSLMQVCNVTVNYYRACRSILHWQQLQFSDLRQRESQYTNFFFPVSHKFRGLRYSTKLSCHIVFEARLIMWNFPERFIVKTTLKTNIVKVISSDEFKGRNDYDTMKINIAAVWNESVSQCSYPRSSL